MDLSHRAILPGADASHEPPIDAPSLALAEFASILKQTHTHAAVAPASAAASAPAFHLASRVAPSAAFGSVAGRVVDAARRTPIVNATVIVTPISGGSSASDLTSPNGSFQISTPAGTYVLRVFASNYSNNTTAVQVYSGSVVNVGTILLVEDGYVTGIVEGSDPTHERIANATVIANSRNGQLTVPPTNTRPNGSFELAVPPTADSLWVGPPANALGRLAQNFTFVAPSSGRTVDLGTVYLEAGTELDLTIRDRVTHAAIGPAFETEVFTCSELTGACPFHPSGGNGSQTPVWAIPGPTILHVLVLGYVVNVTPIGNIRALPFGSSIRLNVNVTPLGVVQFTPGVTGGLPSVGGNIVPYSVCYDPRNTHGGGPFWVDCATSNSNISGDAVCSLTGVEVAVVSPPWGLAPAPCFPGILSRFGVSNVLLGPPLRDYVELGSFLGVAPMFRNETWVNLTADRITDAGYLNFTPGAYLAGHVYLGNTHTAPTSYSLRACSTDEVSICGPVQGFPPPGIYPIDSANASRLGCPTDAGAFCVAAPPGPVLLSASGAGANGGNWTWTTVPDLCCVRSPHLLWLPGSTNVTGIRLPIGNGSVFGHVIGGPGGIEPPIYQAYVIVCSADLTSGQGCEAPAPTANLTFQLPAPFGWDSIKAEATGWQTNTTWIDVTGRNNSGTIRLSPLAIAEGRVVTARGTGILGAALQFCPVGNSGYLQPGCVPLTSPSQSDVTGSGGYYSGYLPGGPYPGSTYMIVASAPGYVDNWTWVNATPGALLQVPSIALASVGPSVPGAVARPAASPQGTWVEGRLVDARTGRGIYQSTLQACLATGSHPCTTFLDSTNWGGSFNDSLPLGAYWLNASAPGFVSASFYVNATSSATTRTGVLSLEPFSWVAGRVLIHPWENWSAANGLGPGDAAITLCANSGQTCGVSGTLSTSGFFNVTGPLGTYDALSITPAGGSPFDSLAQVQAFGSAAGGFDANTTTANVTRAGTSLPESGASVLTLRIFSMVTGEAWDATSWNGTLKRPVSTVRWGGLDSRGHAVGDIADMPLTGGGRFDLFLSPTTNVVLTVSGSAYWPSNNSSVRAPGPALSGSVAPFDLPHFGWITTTVRDRAGQAIPFAELNATVADPGNHTTVSRSEEANGAGFANLSAPPGGNVTLRASAPGHANSSASGTVLPGQTSRFALPPLASAGTVFFLASEQVNTVASPPNPSLIDPLTRVPIEGSTVAIRSGSALVALVDSNAIGEFLVSAPVATSYTLTVDRTGYVPIDAPIPNASAGLHTVGELHLVGDGILAGRVVGEPGGVGVAGAYVSAVETGSGTFEYTLSNGDGEFWIEGPPGNYTVSLQATSFTSNRTYGAQLLSDGFTGMGELPIFADARVAGTVLGLPFLAAVAGANVTLCPLGGGFSDYCPFPIPTDVVGGFSLPVPFGVYWLSVNATGFAPWSVELELLPGEVLDLGAIHLLPDGGIAGSVLDAGTGLPIGGAAVGACPLAPGPCAGPASTDGSGAYLLVNVTPGEERLRGVAVGYAAAETLLEVQGGGTIVAATLRLWPVGVRPLFAVSGQVVWNGTGRAVAGARIDAVEVANGIEGIALSQPNGGFALELPSGTYRLTTTAAGAKSFSLSSVVVANASVSGLLAVLDPILYPIEGTVVGEGAHRPVPGATVRWGSQGFVITSATGAFRIELPNGTFELSATPVLAPSANEFGVARLTIVVDGGAQWANVTLPANLRMAEVQAVDALTGLGIPSASGNLAGTSDFGLGVSIRFQVDPNGSFAVKLPDGQYGVEVTAPGYGGGTGVLRINGSAASAVLVLSPAGAAQGPSTSLGPWWTLPLLAGSAGILLLSLALRRRRRGRAIAAQRPDRSLGSAESSGVATEPSAFDDSS